MTVDSANFHFPNCKNRVCVPDVSPRLLAYSTDVTAIMYPGLTAVTGPVNHRGCGVTNHMSAFFLCVPPPNQSNAAAGFAKQRPSTVFWLLGALSCWLLLC